MDDASQVATDKRIPSIESIDRYLASIKGHEEDAIRRELEELRSSWSNHPLRDVLEPSGFDFED